VANATYDVFVSYSRADAHHAADIDSVLRSKGLNPLFDWRGLAPGLPWLRALEQAIGAAKAAIVLIGPRGLGNTQQYERDLALIRQTHDPAFPVVPVILPETTGDPPFDFLRALTWIDFSHVAKVSDAPDVLEQLLAAIYGGEAAPEVAREAICPSAKAAAGIGARLAASICSLSSQSGLARTGEFGGASCHVSPLGPVHFRGAGFVFVIRAPTICDHHRKASG
jgi:hypothetical protein